MDVVTALGEIDGNGLMWGRRHAPSLELLAAPPPSLNRAA